MAFKFGTNVAKGFKVKVRKFWGIIPYGGKPARGVFTIHPDFG